MAANHNSPTDSSLNDRRSASNDELAQLEAERCRLAQALALAERDRQLLGYEIHDGVVQDLTAAGMLLEGAGRQATFAAPEDKDGYARGLNLLHESIAEIRQLIRGIVIVRLDAGGLVSALTRLVEKFRTDHWLPVQFESSAVDVRLPASIEHLLLRIVQESLTNAWKHAKATEVEVRMTVSEDRLELSVADNGVGFDPAQIPTGHFGLEGIRARAGVLGASLLFDTAPHHGTRIVVQLTVPPLA